MIVNEATITLGFDGKKASDGLSNTRKSIKELDRESINFGRNLTRSLGQFTLLAGEISLISHAAGRAVNALTYIPDELNKTARAIRETSYLSQNIGLPENKIRAFGRIAEQSGASVEAMNGQLQMMADKSARLKAGQSAYSVLGSAFFQFGGNAEKIREGSPEQSLIEYAKIYSNIEKQGRALGYNKEQSQAFASNQLMALGVSQDLIPVLRMSGDEIKKNVAEQSKFLQLSQSEIEDSKKFAKSWTEINQAIDQIIEKEKRIAIWGLADTLETIAHPIDKISDAPNRFKQNIKPLKNEIDFLLKSTSDKNVINFWKNQLKPLINEVDNSTKQAKNSLTDYSNVNFDKIINQFDRLKKLFPDIKNPFQDIGASLGGGLYNLTNNQSVEPAYKPTSAQQKQTARQYRDYLVSKGMPEHEAIGILSNLSLESSLNPKATDYKTHTHHGLAQWDIGRQKAFTQRTGKKILDASWQEQLDLVLWELANTEKKAGNAMKQGRNSGDVAAIMRERYERPANPGTIEMVREMANARAKARQFEKTISIEPTKLQNFAPTEIAAQQTQANNLATSGINPQPIINNQIVINTTDPKTTANVNSEIANKHEMTPYRSGVNQ